MVIHENAQLADLSNQFVVYPTHKGKGNKIDSLGTPERP